MGKTERPGSTTSIGLSVTLPCEARYLPILRQLAARTADHLGYRTTHRDDVVRAIEQAVLGVFEPGDTPYTHVELRLAANGRDMQVRIRYLGASVSQDGATIIEQPSVPFRPRRRAPRSAAALDAHGGPGTGAGRRRRRLLRADPSPPRGSRVVCNPRRMRLYNTLTRQEEPFTPLRGRTVRMYTCGLTVYARGHIGNFRTFVALDVLGAR